MFRFTIRDVLWLVVVVALIVSWQVDRNRLRVLLKTETIIGVSMTIDGPGYFQLRDENQELFHAAKLPDVAPRLLFAKTAYVTVNHCDQLVVQYGNAQFLLEPVITVFHREPFYIEPDGHVFVAIHSSNPSCVGQLPIVRFSREDKLRRLWPADDFYIATDESGPPVFTNPGENGAGLLRPVNPSAIMMMR